MQKIETLLNAYTYNVKFKNPVGKETAKKEIYAFDVETANKLLIGSYYEGAVESFELIKTERSCIGSDLEGIITEEKVLLRFGWKSNAEIAVVSHTTKNFIIVRGEKYRRDGSRVADYGSHHICRYDQRILDKQDEEIRMNVVRRTLSSVKWSSVPDEKCEKVHKLLSELGIIAS